jgi:glycosyltransferase involved in cell wall biosynthesis
LLTAAMIVRDEAPHLDACLTSIQHIVDEIVVVDTGSVDATVDIAQAHGARVFHHRWDGDFSAPRNVSLAHATGRWVLCIDADERLRHTDRARLVTMLERADEAALLVHLYPFLGSTPSLEYRLWRNDPRITFRNVLHERAIDAIHAVAASDRRSVGVCDLTIDHLGFEGDLTHKHHRNLPLLQRQLAVDPDNISNWCHLARVLNVLGRADEANDALERAVALARARSSVPGSVAWADLVAFRHERGDDVTQLLAEGRTRFPYNWSLVWMEGQWHLEAGRHEEAIGCFRALLAVDVDAPQPVVYDQRLFRSWAQHPLGVALSRLGPHGEAAEAFTAAARVEPDVNRYRSERHRTQGTARRAPLLTAAMIVRDEEQDLPTCLASLRGIVDEIVVVDTGSMDRTSEVAREHGARVFRHLWDGNFSRARNVGLDEAHGQWILCIDADERLRPVPRDRVEALLRGADEVGFRVRLHPRPGYTASLDYRLWRNDPRIRFRNAMHEKVVYALREVGAADGRAIGTCELELDHVGYEGDQLAKHQRNLPLLRAQLAAEPANIFNWRHLSQVLDALGRRDEAESVLEHAVALARMVWNEHGGVAWADLVRFRHERGANVTELIAEGRARWPRNWSLVWEEGLLHLETGRNDEAIACFRSLLAVDIETLPLDGVAYDQRIFGSLASTALESARRRSECAKLAAPST